MHAICVQIFRHIAQKSLAIRQYACVISGQSAEKSDNAPYAQSLCGIALKLVKEFDTELLYQLFCFPYGQVCSCNFLRDTVVKVTDSAKLR